MLIGDRKNIEGYKAHPEEYRVVKDRLFGNEFVFPKDPPGRMDGMSAGCAAAVSAALVAVIVTCVLLSLRALHVI